MADDADELAERLAERLGGSVRASAVFGKPVERKGVTVIPVARAKWAFGGGSGADPQRGGGGGGGMGTVRPVGYIEVRRESVVYKPIRDWRPLALLGAALLTVTGLITARSLRR